MPTYLWSRKHYLILHEVIMESISIRPLNDNVIIKKIEERTTDGGLIIPETVDSKSQKGKVIAVGPGKYTDGKLQELTIKVGDNVIFKQYAGTDITYKGKNYTVLKENDLIAIIE